MLAPHSDNDQILLSKSFWGLICKQIRKFYGSYKDFLIQYILETKTMFFSDSWINVLLHEEKVKSKSCLYFLSMSGMHFHGNHGGLLFLNTTSGQRLFFWLTSSILLLITLSVLRYNSSVYKNLRKIWNFYFTVLSRKNKRVLSTVEEVYFSNTKGFYSQAHKDPLLPRRVQSTPLSNSSTVYKWKLLVGTRKTVLPRHAYGDGIRKIDLCAQIAPLWKYH